MYTKLTITVSNSRELDLNPFTLEQEYFFPAHQPPRPIDVKYLAQKTIEDFKRAWPFRGMRHSSVLAVDAKITEHDGRPPTITTVPSNSDAALAS